MEAGREPCPGFIATPSSSFCEASELFEVFNELAVLPATRFCDRVLFKSAKVPDGESEVRVLNFLHLKEYGLWGPNQHIEVEYIV